MTKPTPRSRADSRLSNLIFLGGRSKHYTGAHMDNSSADAEASDAFDAFDENPGETCYRGSCSYCFGAGYRTAQTTALSELAALRAERDELREAASSANGNAVAYRTTMLKLEQMLRQYDTDNTTLRARAERAEAAIRAFLTGHEAPDWYRNWSVRYEALKAFIAAPTEPEGGS